MLKKKTNESEQNSAFAHALRLPMGFFWFFFRSNSSLGLLKCIPRQKIHFRNIDFFESPAATNREQWDPQILCLGVRGTSPPNQLGLSRTSEKLFFGTPGTHGLGSEFWKFNHRPAFVFRIDHLHPKSFIITTISRNFAYKGYIECFWTCDFFQFCGRTEHLCFFSLSREYVDLSKFSVFK